VRETICACAGETRSNICSCCRKHTYVKFPEPLSAIETGCATTEALPWAFKGTLPDSALKVQLQRLVSRVLLWVPYPCPTGTGAAGGTGVAAALALRYLISGTCTQGTRSRGATLVGEQCEAVRRHGPEEALALQPRPREEPRLVTVRAVANHGHPAPGRRAAGWRKQGTTRRQPPFLDSSHCVPRAQASRYVACRNNVQRRGGACEK